MILRSQHKQMSYVATGGNGSSLLFGKVRTALISVLACLRCPCLMTNFRMQVSRHNRCCGGSILLEECTP